MNDFYRYLISKIKKYEPQDKLKYNFVYDKYPINIEGLRLPIFSILLSELFSLDKASFLIILPYEKEALTFVEDLKSFGVKASYFPSWNSLPYQNAYTNIHISGERERIYNKILSKEKCVIVTTIKNILTPVPSLDSLKKSLINFSIGDILNPTDVEKKLSSFGYQRVPRVSVVGEFALRGEVLDIFLAGNKYATRIIFEWDKIEKIRYFDPISQDSFSDLESINIYPISEIIWSDEKIDNLKKYFLEKPFFVSDTPLFIADLKEKRQCKNEDILFPLACDDKTYLPTLFGDKDVVVTINPERFSAIFENSVTEYKALYTQARYNKFLVPVPDDILTPFEDILSLAKNRIILNYIKNPALENRIVFDTSQSHSFFGNINYLKEELSNKIKSGYECFVFAGNESQKTRIDFLLKDLDVTVYPDRISEGFIIPELKILAIAEHEIFGRKKRKSFESRVIRTKSLESFVELDENDYIVHINHGIGLYKGIERVVKGEKERDYIKLEYSGGDIVFIPTEQVNLVQKYIGGEGKKPTLDTLGGKSWNNKKSKTKKSVEDLADMLLDVYSERERSRGYKFSQDTQWQFEFEAKFPYEETEDQLMAISEIKEDMESYKPMDRLICGDAGYGKTEVALRAIFKAVVDGKQVAFIAPTTILAEQHYENAIERFKDFPVKIEMVSRFVKKSRIKEILELTKKGEIDVLIGTHRVLQDDVVFKDLGLLVIDEEQRFGVKHKERFKKMRAGIDCLSMSATPIPRTLHMSLLKIRDMSVIKTAPYNRKPIKTFIQEFNPNTVRDAVMKEVERGGQVFYLHNRIESLDSIKLFLTDLLPELLIESAHGRMSSNELEDKMHRFINNEFHILLSTTIIESGIDIPNVNTIIIDRADMYGVSQLYQLRGRVGRSDRTSNAYLLYPEDRALSELAMKRLQVISNFTELGSGFQVALKDMEIRGAGNLLGREQHGEISAVGYEMYLKLLDEAIADKQHKEKEIDVFLDLQYSGFIPDSYIENLAEKMSVYKQIASINSEDQLSSTISDIEDKYGPIPNQVHSLFSIAEIKIICKKLYISTIFERHNLARIEFAKLHILNVDKVIRLIRENPNIVIYDQSTPNILKIKTKNLDLEQKSEFLCDKLKLLL